MHIRNLEDLEGAVIGSESEREKRRFLEGDAVEVESEGRGGDEGEVEEVNEDGDGGDVEQGLPWHLH